MLKQHKNLLPSGNLGYKLRIAFCLMSVLPLLVCVYLVTNYVLPKAGFRLDATIALSVTISVVISVIGFFVIKEVFDRVVSISSDAKRIAEGDVSRVIATDREDEIGFLGDSLNHLTLQIRNSMDELKGYSEKTTQINLEIQKRVLALSSLLQISSFISQGLKLDEILKLTVEKSHILASSDSSFLFFRDTEEGDFYLKASDGENTEYLSKIRISPSDPVFNKVIQISKPLILDAERALSDDMVPAFYDKFKLKNILALPIFLRAKVTGILCIGNNAEPFSYKAEDIELLDIFAKQISIAVENDLLSRWVEKLEIKDALTGLYNEAFIRSRLQEEIRRAIIYQRPCSLVVFNIDNFEEFQHSFGSLSAESVLKRVAVLIKNAVTEIDRVARTGDNKFGVVLPEKNKRKAQAIAEEIRKKVELDFSKEDDQRKRITVCAALSENPLDGSSAQELFDRAEELLGQANKVSKNCVLI